MILVVLGDLLCTGHVILRMRSKLCSLHNIFSFNIRRSALKVTKRIGKLGPGISKLWTIFAPCQRLRDTAHEQ